MRKITVTEGDTNRRADKFLFEHCPALPKSAVYKAFRNKDIRRNGKRCRFDEILSAGDEMTVWLPDRAFDAPEAASGNPELFRPVFTGENYLLADKPAGIPVQSGGKGQLPCLTDCAAAWERQALQTDSPFRPAPCHRLDTNTSGLVLFARTPAAARAFTDAQKIQAVSKQYLCICIGRPPKNADTVRGYWRKDEKNNRAEILARPFEGAKEAVTVYRLLAEENGLSLLEVRLETGRSHQIRAQMKALGCPLLGDIKYTSVQQQKPYGLNHQALTAYRLSFDRAADRFPPMKELAGKTFSSALPPVFERFFPRYFKKISDRL